MPATARRLTPATIGALVRDARVAAGLSQSQLGNRVGASRFRVAQFEKGKPSAELGLALKALHALGLAVRVGERRSAAPSAQAVRAGAATSAPPAIDLGWIIAASVSGAARRRGRPRVRRRQPPAGLSLRGGVARSGRRVPAVAVHAVGRGGARTQGHVCVPPVPAARQTPTLVRQWSRPPTMAFNPFTEPIQCTYCGHESGRAISFSSPEVFPPTKPFPIPTTCPVCLRDQPKPTPYRVTIALWIAGSIAALAGLAWLLLTAL